MNNGVLNTTDNATGADKEHYLMTHFKYHPPSKGQIPHYQAINDGAKKFAEVILEHTPKGSDQEAALRKIIETKMTANSSIATNPELYED